MICYMKINHSSEGAAEGPSQLNRSHQHLKAEDRKRFKADVTQGNVTNGINGDVQVTSTGLKLLRTVTLLGAISFNMGMIIGSGIFITPTSVLQHTGSVGLALIVWALGGMMSLLGSLTFSELACRVPKHGGQYAYLKEGLGSWVGFLYTFKLVLLDFPASMAVQAMTFSQYFVNSVELCGTPGPLVTVTSVTLIVTLCALNLTSARTSAVVSIVFLYAKLLALGVIIVGGVYQLASGKNETSDLSTGFDGTETSAASIAKSFYFVMWAYGGWNNVNSITEEVKNPKRNIPLASVLSVFAVTIIYLLTIASYLAVMSRQDMLSSSTVAMTWGNKVLGFGLASLLISLSVMASTAGSGNAGLFTSPRIMFSAARDGNMPDVLSYIHVTRRAPIAAILVMVVLGILCCLVADIVTLISFSAVLDWFFYFLCTVALLVIRFRQRGKDDDIVYKQPMVVPVLFMVVCLYLVLVPQLDGLTMDLLYSSVFMVVGIGLYLMFRFFKNRGHICDGLVIFIQLLMRVGPPASYSASN